MFALPGLGRWRLSRALGGAAPWSPAALFADGSGGAFFDPSDLKSLFQDAAGTIPVTAAGQPVGLMLDKSHGRALGPELVVNGGPGFVGATGWSYSGGAGGGPIVTAGDLAVKCASVVSGPSDRSIRWPLTGLVVGGLYKVSYAIRKGSAPQARLTLSTSPGGGDGSYLALATAASPAVSGDIYVRATATTHYIELYAAGGATANQTANLSSLSIKSIAGNHASQPVAAGRPVLKTDGALWWLEGYGIGEFMSTAVLDLTDNLFISVGMRITASGGFGGPWRFLREGGNPTAVGDNRLEEYRNSTANSRRKVIARRYPSTGTIYDNYDARPASEAVSHVSWIKMDAAGARQGVLYPGTLVADTAATKVAVAGRASLDLFRGYSGILMPGRFYAGVFLMRAPTDDEITKTNAWMMAKSGVTL